MGPATSVTAAPASAAACATAKPILPELRFVIPRTVSIGSNVGPAVTSTRRPASGFGPSIAAASAKISAASSIRPMPTSPHAWSPAAGPRIATPSARRRSTFRCVAGLSHIWRFIAGATASGHSRARHSVDRRSSASPLATFARKSAVAGATTTSSRSRDSSMWPMLSGIRPSHMSVNTGLPDSPCMVTGVTNRHAASVITTWTSAPARTNRRHSSAAL